MAQVRVKPTSRRELGLSSLHQFAQVLDDDRLEYITQVLKIKGWKRGDGKFTLEASALGERRRGRDQ
jgi:hypothetical protein